MRLRLSLAIACALAIFGPAAASLRAAPPLPAADRGEKPEPAFAWFDKLGYPDVKEVRFVRIASGLWSRSGDEPAQNRYYHGFLLDDNDTSFRAFIVDTLGTQTFTKTPPMTEEYQRVGYDERDLKVHIDELIRDHHARVAAGPERGWPRRFGERLTERAEFFTLAWAASRRGLDEPAARLFAVVETMAAENRRGDDKKRTARETIAADLGHAEMWASVLLFGAPNVPRADLLARFQRIAADFPESEHLERAKRTAKLLEQMVREDEEHARRKEERPLAERSTKEQIAEWIFRLRDQNGRQWSQPGACDIFLTPDNNENTPAHRLVKFGYDAVPQLIDALDDERLTRSVGYHRDFYFSHYVLTVGSCAETILQQIAQRRFDVPRSDKERTPAKEAAKKKKLVRAWYDSVRHKGEKQSLAEAVELGDDNSPQQAFRLAERFPDDAARSIIAGAKRAGDAYVRHTLIKLLADLPSPEVEPFLLAELKSTEKAACHVAAAMVLHHRNRPEGVAAMLDRWQQASQAAGAAKKKTPTRSSDAPDPTAWAVFLVTSKRTAAVKAVADEMHRFPIEVRMEIVEACDRDDPFNDRLSYDKVKPDPDYDDAVVALLIRALDDDRERREGMSGSYGDKNFDNPRVCDMAGHTLWERNPQKYRFDLGADMATRDRDRRAITVAWHKEKNLPVPPERPPPPPVQVKPD